MEATFRTNLNCGSCVASVTPYLNALDGVRSWDVDTEVASKTLRVDLVEGVDEQSVINAVAASGFKAEISADVESSGAGTSLNMVSLEAPTKPTKEPFRLSRYRPLLLVVGYIVAACGFLELQAGSWDGMRFMRHFMGLFFLGFAFFKLLDVGKFADAFATYDVIAKRSRGYALFYPFLELMLGVTYLFDVWPLPTNVLTAVIMGVGLVGVIDVVRRGQTIQCACLGTAFNLPMSAVTIIENSVMLVMALVGIINSV